MPRSPSVFCPECNSFSCFKPPGACPLRWRQSRLLGGALSTVRALCNAPVCTVPTARAPARSRPHSRLAKAVSHSQAFAPTSSCTLLQCWLTTSEGPPLLCLRSRLGSCSLLCMLIVFPLLTLHCWLTRLPAVLGGHLCTPAISQYLAHSRFLMIITANGISAYFVPSIDPRTVQLLNRVVPQQLCEVGVPHNSHVLQ